LLTSSCIRDGLDECPDPHGEYYSYIKFVYDYNMSFEDLFHRQVSKIDLFLFDENGLYMQKLSDRAPNGSTFNKGYIMGLPEDYKDVTQFVAFPGIYEDQLNVTNMIPGQSTINDLYVRLNDRNDNIVNQEIKPLWHGNIAAARTKVNRNDTTVISLTKNTNKIRIVLQSLIDTLDVNVNDFSFELQSVNGSYDSYNTPADDSVWFYEPYFTYNDDEAGAVAELNTMRLMSDRENYLVISYLSNDMIDINLNRYLNALKLQEYTTMSLQEYMDREDEYKIIIFLTKTGIDDPDPNPDTQTWVATKISINSWNVRDQGGMID